MGLAVVLVLAVGVPLALAGTALVLWLRSRSRRMHAALDAELAAEPAVRGPEPVVYRGSTSAHFPAVLGNGLLVLTERRLLLRKLAGRGFDVQRSDITGTGSAKVFNGGVVGGRAHLVVHTRQGDVGFFVTDLDAWAAALRPGAGAAGR